MTGEAHGAVVTDPAVNTQVFLWHEGFVCVCVCVCVCVYIYIYIYSLFLLAVLGLRCCAGFSLVLENAGYSPVAGHTFLIAGASCYGARAPEHRLTVVSQGLSCSHTWNLLEPGSSATLTSYVRIESEGDEGDVCYWCLAGKEGDPSQMVRVPDFLMGLQ